MNKEKIVDEISGMLCKVEKKLSSDGKDTYYGLQENLESLGDGGVDEFINDFKDMIIEDIETLMNDEKLGDFEKRVVAKAKAKFYEII